MASRDREIDDIEAFLSEEKRLQGPHPAWGRSIYPKELSASWPVEDSLGVVRAEFRFRCPEEDRTTPSMSLLFRQQPIWRIDLGDDALLHLNPPIAERLGLPPTITGPHEHGWPDNAENIRGMTPPDWRLTVRRPISPQMRRLSQALPWLADRIRLLLEPSQRGFDVPPRSDLFGNS